MTTLTLSCDDFHGKLSAGLLTLLESEQLANVTIAVDGKCLKANQMVLSICSSYFKTLLETNPSKHPIIFMKDVKYHIMKQLLQFMYEGATEIDAEDFPIFIETAQALEIKWLAIDDEYLAKENTNPTNTSPPHISTSTPKTIKRPLKPEPELDTSMEEPDDREISSNIMEQSAKRPKANILSENQAENIINYKANEHIAKANELETTDNKEHIAQSEEMKENSNFEHPEDETCDIDDDLSYEDMPVDDEDDEIIEIDNYEEDNILEQLPQMPAGYHASNLQTDMNLPDTLTSTQVNTLQVGNPILVTFYLNDTRKSYVIMVNNYLYFKSSASKNTSIWRCGRYRNNSKRNSDPCQAAILLTSAHQLVDRSTHNHSLKDLSYKSLQKRYHVLNQEIYFLSSLEQCFPERGIPGRLTKWRGDNEKQVLFCYLP